MKVLNIYVKNIQSVSEIDLNLSGHNLFVLGGRNEMGKSSTIKALLMALCGRSGMDGFPDSPIREGENEAIVRVALSGDSELHEDVGFIAELIFTRQRNGTIKESFRLIDSGGEEAPEPRTLLKRLYELKAFDPTEFDRLDRKGKRDLLQRLVPGLDFSSQDAEVKQLFDERTDVNRDGKKLKAQTDAMKFYADAPAEPVSVSALTTELQRRQAVNKANGDRRLKVVQLEKHEDLMLTNQVNAEREVEQLQARLKQAVAVVESYRKMHESAVIELGIEKTAVELLQDEDTQSVLKEINEAGAVNEKVRANILRKQKLAELDELRRKSQELTDRMEAIKEAKEKAIKEAVFPVPGLGFDDEGVTYEGLPYEQASRSKRFRIGAKIGMALNPKLKTLICEHGSDLDWESLAELEQMCKETGYQAIVEVATRSKEDDARCQVVFKDGSIEKGSE